MSDKEQIRKDIQQYMDEEEQLTRLAKRELLQSIFDKHFVLSEGDLVLNKHDFNKIVSDSKRIMSSMTLPAVIGSSSVDAHEVNVLACIEAAVQVLNSKGAFRRLPKFNK